MPATVHHPDPAFTGTATIGRRRLTFTDGQALLTGPAASWRRAGYQVGVEAATDQLDALTVPELRDLADQRDVDLTGARTKADVIDAIQGADLPTVEDADGDDPDS